MKFRYHDSFSHLLFIPAEQRHELRRPHAFILLRQIPLFTEQPRIPLQQRIVFHCLPTLYLRTFIARKRDTAEVMNKGILEQKAAIPCLPNADTIIIVFEIPGTESLVQTADVIIDRPPEKQANRSAQYELKVIRRIVQKYKGTLTLEEQGEFFAEKIIFPLQK